MYKKLIILLLLTLVVGLPFVLKRQNGSVVSEDSDRTLVVITAHDETIRYEFSEGFRQWYQERTGERVSIDWRMPGGGGTQNAVRYVDSVFLNSFRLHWEEVLGREWSFQVQEALKHRVDADSSEHSPYVREVLDIFNNAPLSCGVDVFFGGGKMDVVLQARKGQLEKLRIFEDKKDLFDDGSIPYKYSGNNFYDPEKYWVGTAISGFGIITNQNALDQLDIAEPILQWADLANPKLVGNLGVTDPSGSGVFTMVFEIILQQQMQRELKQLLEDGFEPGEDTEKLAVSEGWMKGMEIIQLISANARYFTEASTQPVLDVSTGNCAAGMAIDFYGHFQMENLLRRSGSKRFSFIMPVGGSAISPDPVSIFRGAPNKDLAEAFVEYLLSLEGQKLWDFRPGTPSGPKEYAISRAPIRRELYKNEYRKFRLNPKLDLYRDAADFHYHQAWTAPLFKEIRFIIKSAFIDAHKELTEAWTAIIEAEKEGRDSHAQLAMLTLGDLSKIDHEQASGYIKEMIHSGDPLEEVRLQSYLIHSFREQYMLAKSIALGLNSPTPPHHD